MSANLISNKTLSNSVIPLKSGPEALKVFTDSGSYVIPNWYYSLTAILISGGGGALNSLSSGAGAGYPNGPIGGQGGGGAGALVAFKIPAKPGDTITVTVGAGGARNTLAGGGSTSISVNGVSFISVGGGGPGGNANAIGGGGTVNGSAGGINGSTTNGGTFYTAIPSVGAGICGGDFFCNIASYTANTTAAYLSTATFQNTYGGFPITTSPGYGSTGNLGTGGTYSTGGGGGGALRNNPGGLTTGGGGTILFVPTLTGNPLKFYVCCGGSGGLIDDPYSGVGCRPGWAGGSVTDGGTTYYLGGSGGGVCFDGNGNYTSATNGGNGAINTGSGGGGAPGRGLGLGGLGGSGLAILIGQRSYPFSGKPII